MPGLRFCFASELKALTILPGFRAEVDYAAVSDFLALSYIPDPETIYRGVSRLEPGQSIRATRSGVQLRRYWEPQFEPEPQRDFDASIEEIRGLAKDAVERRLMSDVPLGAFLSGGVDSSAVVGLMASSAPDRVKTFSIGFTDKQFDELRFARMAVERNQTEHHEQVVSPSIEEAFEALVSHFDEPFGDDSAVPMLYLSRMTRQHVTVALCGDGADELFGGYRRYYFGVLEERLRRKFPEFFRRSVIRAGGKCYPKFDFLPRVFRAKTLLTNLSQNLADSYFTSMSAFRDMTLQELLSAQARRESGGDSPRNASGRASDAGLIWTLCRKCRPLIWRRIFRETSW